MESKAYRQIDVLDHGFVRLVDVMGADSSIVQAARVSYGEGTKSYREDGKLLEYLYSNEHMSPFEMVEFKFHIKAPLFIARQFVRHRMASWNEVSARYSEMKDEFYVPDLIRAQDNKNRQGSAGELPAWKARVAQGAIREASRAAYATYKWLLWLGVSRETARMVLPTNLYTEWYWKIDLRNLLHFLDLRTHSHAQAEMREYANAIAQIVSETTPRTHELWRNK